MNFKRIVIAGFVVWIVGFLYGWLTCGGIFNWVYQLPPNIWKAPEEMMSIANMVGSNVISLLTAFIFTVVFAILYKGIPGVGIKKGIIYALLVWFLGALTGIAGMPFYMTISTTVVIYWLIASMVINIVNGIILSAIYKEK